MKKQKFMKLTAFTSEPELANSFAAPATHDGELSVVFRGRDISIHGYDGSVWSTIYTWDGIDKQFTFNNTYQNYFLKSLTGSQETVGVSFFSTSRYQGSTPSLAGIDRDVKLHDIDEVPIYTASDVNKMLTIMSDGSLRWLLANESFIIPSEGASGLEEDSGLVLYGNAQLSDGILTLDGTSGTYASLPHSTDYDRESGDLTVHFWFNADSLPSANSNYTLMSKFTGAHDWNGWKITYSTQAQDQSNSGPLMASGGIGVYASNQGSGGAGAVANNFRATSAGGVAIDTWHHVAVAMPASGDYIIYLNGQSVGAWTPPYRNDSTNTELLFGASKEHPPGSIAKFFPGELDQVSISKSILTASEIYDLHAAGHPSANESEEESGGSTPGSITGLEESNGLTLHGNAQLIDGVLHFDGTTGTYASLPHSTDYDRENGDLTISMWFKANSLPNNWNVGLVSKMGNGWQGYITAVTTMNGLTEGGLQTSTWLHSQNQANARASLSEGITLGQWHHAAYVMVETGRYKMYFDGQEVKSYNPAHRNTTTTGDLRIGGWHNGIYHGYFDGQIEGIKIEKTARSAAEILEEYNSGQGESSPSYLESSSTLYGDASFNDGTLVLDGTGDYAVIDDGFRFTDKMTTSVWFRTTATGDRRIYSSHVRSLGLNGFFARLANGQLKFRHPAGGAGEIAGPSGLNDGQWHHMAVSWEASVGYTLYVDGAQISSGGAGVANGYIAGWGLYIGANPWNRAGQQPYGFFSGEIRNFEIENEVLTSQQVTDLYNVGAPAPGPAPSVSTGIEALGTNTLSGDAQVTAEGLLITNDGYSDTQSNYHNGATEQTISAWFKASELGTVNGNNDTTWRQNGHVIAITRNWAAGGHRANGFVLAVAGNAIRFVGPHISNSVTMVDYNFFPGNWYKIEMVWTSNSVKVYVNGVEVGAAAMASGNIAGGAVNLRIGRNINQFMSFKGNILGVEIQNVAKSDAEILSSYQSEV